MTGFITKAGKIVPIFIYIDVLDECGLEEERNLMDYLQTLISSHGSTADMPLKICFSCRHYPYINVQNCLEICAEKENENDITAYIRTVFEAKYLKVARGTDITIIEAIRVDILKRSSNVFQWVALIFKIIGNMYAKRETWKFIRKKIFEVPKGLTDLFTHLLSIMDEENRPKTSSLLRWIQFAKRPLTLNELRIAMAFHIDMAHTSLKSWRESDDYYESNDQWKERIIYLSAGLVEVVRRERYYYAYREDNVIVQFIHASVKDYLQKDGIPMLGIKQAGSVVGQCHKQIARSCVFYIKCPELSPGDWLRKREEEDEDRWSIEVEVGEVDDNDDGNDDENDDGNDDGNDDENGDENGDKDGKNEDETVFDDEKFLEYVIEYWLWHSEQAENEHCSLADVLVWFDYPSLKFVRKYHDLENGHYSTYKSNSGSEYLHLASRANLSSMASVLLKQDQLNVDEKDISGQTPLYIASNWKKENMVELLLKSGANVNAQNGYRGNALQAAAYKGHLTVVKMLLRSGANVNAQGGTFGSPLQAAANRGHLTIVKLLLKSGADVNAQGGRWGSALHAAKDGRWYSESERDAVIQYLLNAGAKPTKRLSYIRRLALNN